MKLQLQYFAEPQPDPTEGTAVTETMSPTEGENTAQAGKTFSQDDVNRIVGERLAKERNKAEAALSKKAEDLAKRELDFQIKQVLIQKDLPESLMPALRGTDEESLKSSIEIVMKVMEEMQGKKSDYTIGSIPRIRPLHETNALQKAMGLIR